METEHISFLKKTWVRRSIIAVLCVLVLFSGLVWLGLHMDDVLHWKAEREARAYDAMLQADMDKLHAMEKADTYGSTTPEGTTLLIIAALEDGDLTLASKYYYVLDQEKALVSFQKQLAEKGNVNTAISFFKDLLRGTKQCNEAGDGCTLEYEYLTEEDVYVNLINNPKQQLLPKGSPQVKSNDLRRNRYTNVWKAID